MTLLRGKVWKFGDLVNTDIIIPFRFKARTNDPYEMAKYCMYGLDPDFSKKVNKGDLIVAGRNFGGGSSREQAPVAIKYCGISAVVAESFARIFYRNAFAIGLPVFELPGITQHVNQGDELEIDVEQGEIRLPRNGQRFRALPVTGFLEELRRTDGLVNYYKQHGRFPWQRAS